MAKEEKFTYLDSKNIEHTVTISEEDFKLTQVNKEIHDQKFQTKPTTFMRDALKRFAKNKSSIVGAVVLGTLMVLAFLLPAVLPQNTNVLHPNETLLAPKLFESGTGFWDGCIDYNHVANEYDWENDKKGYPAGFDSSAIVGGLKGVKLSKLSYTDSVNDYAKGGLARVWAKMGGSEPTTICSTKRNWDFETYDYIFNATIPEIPEDVVKTFSAVQAKYSLVFIDYSGSAPAIHRIGDYKTVAENFVNVNLSDAAATIFGSKADAKAKNLAIGLSLEPSNEASPTLMIENLSVTAEGASEEEAAILEEISIQDANKTLGLKIGRDQKLPTGFWSTLGGQTNLYKAKIYYCDFRFDTYQKAYGVKTTKDITQLQLKEWSRKGYIKLPEGFSNFETTFKNKVQEIMADEGCTEDVAIVKAKEELLPPFAAQFKVKSKKIALIIDDDHPFKVDFKKSGSKYYFEFEGYVRMWQYLGYSSMPKFLFGTDKSGKDIVKITFSGLRTSLLLGVLISAVCFSIGLVYGAIAGYFGGWTDILMERFSDILSGIPWIVMMTLIILNMGSGFWTFVLAECLTGWIGTASLTRTQFYRFKDREYILAARTLGANDFRLIFKHILPNAVGTIVTSTALMIPSVIFSEATISYLGLGFKNLDSFGVILSDNQQFIKTKTPWLILFPSIVMAFIMISFNLFGNGLRDAFNPSLKGQD